MNLSTQSYPGREQYAAITTKINAWERMQFLKIWAQVEDQEAELREKSDSYFCLVMVDLMPAAQTQLLTAAGIENLTGYVLLNIIRCASLCMDLQMIARR